jgi:hypothetical protein
MDAENVRAETSLGLEIPETPVSPKSGARVRVTVTVVTLTAPHSSSGAAREDVVIEALDDEVLGVRLPRGTGGSAPAGRGLLVVRGSITQPQVALPALIEPADQPQTVTERVPIATPPWVTVTLTTPSSAPV